MASAAALRAAASATAARCVLFSKPRLRPRLSEPRQRPRQLRSLVLVFLSRGLGRGLRLSRAICVSLCFCSLLLLAKPITVKTVQAAWSSRGCFAPMQVQRQTKPYRPDRLTGLVPKSGPQFGSRLAAQKATTNKLHRQSVDIFCVHFLGRGVAPAFSAIL